jgi:ABC-2 type transport system ATP-binding protein
MVSVIEAHGLTKLYDSRQGITNLELRVNQGEIFGYLGPNGSGKTTTIRLMLGLIRPDKGEILISGKKVTPGSAAMRAGIGYVPGEASLPENTTGKKALAFYERLSGRRAENRNWLCSQLHLQEGDLKRSIRSLSRGTKQKIAIVQALQHDPELVILDEPTSGLDPLSQEAFFDILHDLRDRGRTIFFSSHVLSEVQRLCDRVAVLRDGRKVLESTMTEMAARADRLLWIKLRGSDSSDVPVDPQQVPQIPGTRFIRADTGGWLLYLAAAGESQRLIGELARMNPVDFRLEPALEESFLKLYGVKVRSLQDRGVKK